MRSSRPSWRRRVGQGVAAVALIASTASCAGQSSTPAAPTLSYAWVRLPAPMATLTAAYLTVTGGSQADAITGVSTSIASGASLHQTVTDASGMTGMQAVDRIEVGAGATVRLEPGGYHVMLEGLTGTLSVGETVQLTVTFEHAGAVTVQAVVRQG